MLSVQIQHEKQYTCPVNKYNDIVYEYNKKLAVIYNAMSRKRHIVLPK